MSIFMENNYPIELEAPDISAYKRGNTGIDYVHQFDSGKNGPHVMISAIVHGNELCGAVALDHLFRNEVRPIKGKLSLAFMNYIAFQRFNPEKPKESRFVEEDFNRLWTKEALNGVRDSLELNRAREICPHLEKIDFLLDIHSMQTNKIPLVLSGPLKKGRNFARKIGVTEIVVTDSGHKAGRRMRDYNSFSNPSSKKNALLIECGQHWQNESAILAIDSSWRFLWKTGVIEEEQAVQFQKNNKFPEKQRFIEVNSLHTIKTESFRFVKSFVGLEIIEKAGTTIGYDGDEVIKTPHDDCILIMPTHRKTIGNSAVRFGKIIYTD